MLLATSCLVPAQIGESISGGSGDTGGGGGLAVPKTGIQLYGVSLFASRAQTTVPAGGEIPGTTAYRDLSTGISGSMGWARMTENANTSAFYSGSYGARPSNLDLSATSHAFGVRQSRSMGPRISWNVSLQGAILNSQDLLFTPAGQFTVTAAPPTFDNLAGSSLAGTSVVDSPARLLVLGTRILSSSAGSQWSIAASPRTNYTFALGATRNDRLNGNDLQNTGTSISPGALPGSVGSLSSFSSIQTQAAVTHTLSPRTALGADLNLTRSFARNQDAYVNNTSMFVERILTPRLKGHIDLGVGFVKPLRKSATLVDRPQFTGNGSLTYKISSQTLMISATRSVADSFGLGANVLDSYAGAWGWVPRGGGWSLQVNGGIDRMNNVKSGSLNVWRAGGSVSRRLGPWMLFSAQYARMSFSNNDVRANILNYETSLEGVRMSLTITPRRGTAY